MNPIQAWQLLLVAVAGWMKLSNRQVHLAGITEYPHGDWMKQIGRNMTGAFDGFLSDVRHIILDRDPLYATAFRDLLQEAGVKPVRLPPRSPNLHAYAERFERTIKECCLRRMIFFGEVSLRGAITEFLEHFHHARNHQGLENRLIDPQHEVGLTDGDVQCREGLGGVVRYYYRDAA